jgi:hypothetical protein
MGAILVDADDNVEPGGKFLIEHLQHRLVPGIATAEKSGDNESAFFRNPVRVGWERHVKLFLFSECGRARRDK